MIFYTNFSLLKIKFDEWGSKKGLLVSKDSNKYHAPAPKLIKTPIQGTGTYEFEDA